MGSYGIASSITKPLGFFVLTLFIVEAFLGAALTYSNLSPEHKWWVVCIGVGLFILLVGVVALLVWCKPTNLVYSEDAHLKHEKMFGTKEDAKTYDEIVQLKSRSLTPQFVVNMKRRR